MRATWSTDPPGGNTTTRWMGCLMGQAWAWLVKGTARVAAVMVSARTHAKMTFMQPL